MTHHWHRITAHKCILIDPDTHKQDYLWAKCPVWDDPITTGWWNPTQTGTKHKTDRTPVSVTEVKTDDNMASVRGGDWAAIRSHPLPVLRANFTVVCVRERFLFRVWICVLHVYWLLTLRHVGLSLILFPLLSVFRAYKHTVQWDTYTTGFHLMQWTLEPHFSSSALINAQFDCFCSAE